jgi:predicted nucleotidyltransferase
MIGGNAGEPMGILDAKRELINEACRRFGVSRMHVFGSALREDFRPGESDIDLLVEFSPIKPAELADAYFNLLEDLSSILNTPVDLVMSDAVKNPYIAADIDKTKQVFYAS